MIIPATDSYLRASPCNHFRVGDHTLTMPFLAVHLLGGTRDRQYHLACGDEFVDTALCSGGINFW